MVTVQNLIQQFPDLLSHHSGPSSATAKVPCGSDNPQKNAICYTDDPKQAQNSLGKVSILVTRKDIADQLKAGETAVLVSPNVHVAMAHANQKFFTTPLTPHFTTGGVHPSAVVDPKATVAKSAFIGPNCVVEAGASIGENTVLESQVYVGHNCVIGNSCRVQPFTVIGTEGFGFATDKQGHHHRKPHYGRVILKDRVEVGAGVNIDRGTFDDVVIGEGTKIDNHCHIGHNNQVGKNCMITAGLISAGSTIIGDSCYFGGRTSLGGHLSITSQVRTAGASVVTKDILKSGDYGGYPLMPLKEFFKNYASITQLTRMRKDLHRVMKKLGIGNEE